MPSECGIAVFANGLGFFDVHDVFVLLVEQDLLQFGLCFDKELNHDAFNQRKDPGDLLIEWEVEFVASLGDNENLLILESDECIKFFVGEEISFGGR